MFGSARASASAPCGSGQRAHVDGIGRQHEVAACRRENHDERVQRMWAFGQGEELIRLARERLVDVDDRDDPERACEAARRGAPGLRHDHVDNEGSSDAP